MSSAATALAFWLAYVLLAFVVRVALHLRRTGRSGLVVMRAGPGSAPWAGELAQGLGLALVAAAPPLALAEVVEPIATLDAPAGHLAGVLLSAFGLAGVVGSQGAMGASWRIGVDPGERTELVTTGPFRIVRNPIFSFLICFHAGLALLVPSAPALAGLALLIASFELQVRLVEEPYLLRSPGEAYADYARRVGRFVPGLGRLRVHDPGSQGVSRGRHAGTARR